MDHRRRHRGLGHRRRRHHVLISSTQMLCLFGFGGPDKFESMSNVRELLTYRLAKERDSNHNKSQQLLRICLRIP